LDTNIKDSEFSFKADIALEAIIASMAKSVEKPRYHYLIGIWRNE